MIAQLLACDRAGERMARMRARAAEPLRGAARPGDRAGEQAGRVPLTRHAAHRGHALERTAGLEHHTRLEPL
jgi:hypothetical protein